MKRSAFVAPIVMLLWAAAANGQSASVEVDQTVGYSTDDLTAAATQVRAFGNVAPGTRFKVEAAWAARSADNGDAFETAYPYGNRIQMIEAYGEHLFAPRRGIMSVRGGRYRTPFGIYDASDHTYFGFLRSPLVRYDEYFAVSNTQLEQGGDVVVGWPRLSLEASVGVPGDVGEEGRRMGTDTVLRGQGAIGALIVGGSYMRSSPSSEDAPGHARFQGIDARWMRQGVQVRGEWMWGRPFEAASTKGGYVDLIVHRPAMGPVTAMMRAERAWSDAESPARVDSSRYIAAARIRLFNQFAIAVELVREYEASEEPSTAMDIGFTYSLRADTRH